MFFRLRGWHRRRRVGMDFHQLLFALRKRIAKVGLAALPDSCRR
jgi:hypothetical protein